MRNSRRSQEGWLMIDHRASPGTAGAFAPGSGFICVPEGKVFETRTLHCTHCGCCFVVNPDRTRARGHCYQCDHYICDICAFQYQLTGICQPYVAKALGELRKTIVGPNGSRF